MDAVLHGLALWHPEDVDGGPGEVGRRDADTLLLLLDDQPAQHDAPELSQQPGIKSGDADVRDSDGHAPTLTSPRRRTAVAPVACPMPRSSVRTVRRAPASKEADHPMSSIVQPGLRVAATTQSGE